MARNFVIRTKYEADGRQVEKTHSKMGRSFGRFAAQMADGNSTIGRSFGKMNQTINRGIAILMTTLIASVGLATAEYIKFDQAITQTVAKFADVDIGTQRYIDTQKELAEESRRVAAVSEFSATALAGAADKYAMAGVTSEQTLKLLAGTTDLATAANVDLVTAVDIATDSLGAFGKMTNNTVQLEKNLTQISDQMAKTTTTANTSLTELFEAVGNGAKTFTDAGQTMATFNASAGLLANASIKGGEAGTALRNVMLRLSKPTAEAQKVLDQLGVTTQDQSGNFRDIVDIIADFETGLTGMGTAQQTAALASVFGARTVNSFNVLLGEGSERLRQYREQIEQSNGASQEMAEAMRTSLANQIEVLKSGLIELGFQFVEAFESDGRGALQSLIDFVQQLDVTPVVNFVQTVVGFLTFLANNWEVILSFAAAIKAVSVAMGILNIATAVFGATLAATPVGIIIAAVGVLVGLFTFLASKVGGVGNAFKVLGRVIMTVLLSPLNLLIGAYTNLLQLLSLLPGKAGEGFAQMANDAARMQDKMNKMLTGSESSITFGADDLINKNAGIGSPETPTPQVPQIEGLGGAGTLDINIRNTAGENAEINQSKNMPVGTKVNMVPVYGL